MLPVLDESAASFVSKIFEQSTILMPSLELFKYSKTSLFIHFANYFPAPSVS